jgi:Uncharacterized conserved protein
MSYTIQLPVFEGPLDLLLRLIERAELEITSIAVAQVADQYLAHVRQMEAPEPRALSEFLVLAARLILIKSRALLPKAPSVTQAADPSPDMLAEELAEQLRVYQRLKQAAELFRAWESEGRRVFSRSAPPPELPSLEVEPIRLSLRDMLRAIERRMRLLNASEFQNETLVLEPRLSVREAAERIRSRLERQQWFTFTDLLSLNCTRQEVIVYLWAILELLKRQVVQVEQTTLFGEVSVGRGSAWQAEIEELEE